MLLKPGIFVLPLYLSKICHQGTDCEGFCNFDQETYGQCESCDDFTSEPDCDSAFYGLMLNWQGQESCIERCTGGEDDVTCYSNDDCDKWAANGNLPGKWFCNFKHETYGGCMDCSDFPDYYYCIMQYFPPAGEFSCMGQCFNDNAEPDNKSDDKESLSVSQKDPVLIACPVDKAHKLEAFEEANPKVNANSIKYHGCHCSTYSGNTAGGSPVDDLDAACRDWNTKSHCLTLEGGACSNGIDFDTYNVQLNADGSVSNDVEFGCAYVENECQEALCRLGYEFGMFLFDSVAKNGPGSYNWNGYITNAKCTPNAPVSGHKVCV